MSGVMNYALLGNLLDSIERSAPAEELMVETMVPNLGYT
jgi:hypothetical protein